MDRTAIHALRESRATWARSRQEGHMRAYLARRASLPAPVGNIDDDIPEWEAEARKAEVARAKAAKWAKGLCPELSEPELAEILP